MRVPRSAAVVLTLAMGFCEALAQEGRPVPSAPETQAPRAAAALRSIVAPASVRQGDPFFAIAWMTDLSPVTLAASPMTARLRYADGTLSPAFPAYLPPAAPMSAAFRYLLASEGPVPARFKGYGAAFALLGVPMDAAPGPATLYFESGGLRLGERALNVQSRAFESERIWLNPALTGIRVDPDPIKQEQSRRYMALISSVDPAGVHLDLGFTRPVTGERRTSQFGFRRTYLYAGGGSASSLHYGVDFGYPTGTPVVAAGRGRVVMAEDRISTGKTVVIEHLPGVYTIYMHLSAMAVSAGAMVGRAEPIGQVGATGLATGPHLHWELRVMGIACDPEALVGLDKVPDIRTILPAIEGG